MPINADMLTSEIGLAIAAAINKHCKVVNHKQPKEARVLVGELHWQAELILSNGDVLELSEW